MTKPEMIEIENVNLPGRTTRVEARRYREMREALLRVVPAAAPGLTAREMVGKVLPLLPPENWPGGAKAGWWQKTVQLDLEAKGLLRRDPGSKPLRWYRP